MKAYLRSARIAPKKANIIAKMVRGMPVGDAMHALSRTNKKGARMVEELLKSAVANAEHNDKQDGSKLMVKTIVVNQSLGYRRGVPMARGRMRPMTKFLSHIAVTLGMAGDETAPSKKSAQKAQKSPKSSSQKTKNQVQPSGTKRKKEESSTDSSVSADTSVSSAS